MADILLKSLQSADGQPDQKFIWSAKVVDNKDPLLLNRIRVSFDTPINGINDESILKSVPDTFEGKKTKNDSKTDMLPEFKWTKIDPFCFLPLLPLFLKVTPKENEYVNILWPNPDYKFVEQYYVQGIFSSPLTIYNENAASSRMFATKDRLKTSVLLKNPTNAEYYNPKTKGVFPEPDDVALMGRGTCDLIIKDTDVILRAGKSTTLPNNRNNEIISRQSRSFVQLSDFSNRITQLEPEESSRLEQNVQFVKCLIEWNILNPDNQSNNFRLEIYVYRLPGNSAYTTNKLFIDTEVNQNDKGIVRKMEFENLTSSSAADIINKFIEQVNEGKLNLPPNSSQKIEDQHPLIFRPSPLTYKWLRDNSGSIEFRNISDIASRVKFKKEGKNGFGLIFFKNKTGQQSKIRKEVVKKFDFKNTPTTYNVLGADKILIISHESKIIDKPRIILDDTTMRGISQEFLAEKVVPNTNAVVRGEELMKFLNQIVKFLVSHVHAYPGLPPVPVATDGTQSQKILSDLQNANNTILNQNIRIN